MKHRWYLIVIAFAVLLFPMHGPTFGQQITDLAAGQSASQDTNQWWVQYVRQSMFNNVEPVSTDLQTLIFLALQHSQQVKVYSEAPLIRQTAVDEAGAAFDWSRYFDGLWQDIDEPVGSTLTVGGSDEFFEDHNLTLTGGFRRRLRNGIDVDVSQRIGHQNTNSNFFIPQDQGTAQLSLGINIPLLQGRGVAYNNSLQVLAGIDVATAKDEFRRQLQSHLLEIIRAYWSLYLERASLSQRQRLASTTKDILDQIRGRLTLDASPVQISTVQAAMAIREAELIRAAAAVRNAETRIRALINAPELGNGTSTELIPVQLPEGGFISTNVQTQMQTAILNRPEILAATKEMKAASVRLNVSKHELLPRLDLITRTFLSGLQGESDIGAAWLDQFRTGKPSYTIGIQYEIPIGNRAARTQTARRQIEQRQIESQYLTTVENVRAEVEIAVRELDTAYQEMRALQLSVNAAQAELNALTNRWTQMIASGTPGSQTLESLLRSQERLTEAEFSLARSQLTYNLALANLNLANGSLLEAERVSVGTHWQDGLKQTILSNTSPTDTFQPHQ